MERYRTTIILVALFAVLVVLLLFVNQGGGGTGSNATPTAAPVTYVWEEPNQVVGIDVMSGTERTALSKNITETTWSIVQPVQKPADIFAVGGEADQLQKLQATHYITETSNLAQYGLDKAPMSVTVTFSDTQHTTHKLLVGNAAIGGSDYYVKTGDSNKVYTVSNGSIEPLRTWLTTPPVVTPSPTPLPTVMPPAPTATSTVTPQPSVGGTATISGTLPITNTQPGAANATTPVAGTATPTP